jgi:hypothetical protein
MPLSSGAFKATEDVSIVLYTEGPTKTVQIGADLDPK